jgi:hypothetical protein
MFTKQDDKWERFRVQTDIMAKTPRRDAPEDFTARVMSRLPGTKESDRSFSSLRSLWTRLLANYPARGRQLPATTAEYAFYVFLTGFFYLVLGFVLFLGMRGLESDVAGSSWLRLQPFVGFFFACWFFAISILLKSRRQLGLKAARVAIFIYLEIILVNAALPLIKFGSQWYLLPFWGLTAVCVIIGGYLALMLQSNFNGGAAKIAAVKGWRT